MAAPSPRSSPTRCPLLNVPALLLAAAALAWAPAVRADAVDLQHWHNIFAQGRFAPPSPAEPSSPSPPSSSASSLSPALYYLEVQPRVSFGAGIVERILFRGAVGFEVVPSLTLWAGIGAIPGFREGRWHPDETRLWQQVQWTPRLDAARFLLRGRLEERAFTAEPDVAVRARAMARVVVDLPWGDGGFGAVAFDEVFFGVVGPAARLGFDQNRAFVGVLRRIAPWWTTEAGYLFVQVGAPGADGARQLHTLLLQTIFTFL